MPRPSTGKVVTQQYPFTAAAATIQASPASKLRAYLMIQNQGVNEIRMQFDKPSGNVNDLIIAGRSSITWEWEVPVGSINISCAVAGGSLGVIIEGRVFDG